MGYISFEKLVEARGKINHKVRKADTFSGLMLFLFCVCNSERNGTYIKSDMRMFSEYADKAFCLSTNTVSYSEKYWYALLTNDWFVQIKSYFLNDEKLSLKDLMYSLFWYETETKIYQILENIPEYVLDELFVSDINVSDFVHNIPISRQSLASHYGSQNESITLKFDDSFVKKRAGDLSGAPFGQTLYAGKEIKKIISVYDFDFMTVYDLDKQKTINNKYINDSEIQFLSKPFLLLAGISGTGKTRFIREQVKMTGALSDTYCMTSVRPDWHEPSDILGYISRLGGDGNAEYITTDVLQFIAKAWRAIIDADLELTVDENRLMVTGHKDQLNQVLPYWLCLDEMNLAPVEQYFADYLSILETREWFWNDNDSFHYCCDPILKAVTIEQLEDRNQLRDALGFIDEKYQDAWDLFCKHGLSLPFNLIVAGTVNMDETTHGFSRKVIDRALSFDFGAFFPNHFDDFFESNFTHNALSYPIFSHAKKEYLPEIDSDGYKSIEFLKSVNQVLDNTSFQLAFRALNELLLAVISIQPKNEQQLQSIWDDFLMCKVFPRIEGDSDKLALMNKVTGSNEQSLLTELEIILEQELSDIWPKKGTSDYLRPDLYRKNADGSVLNIACRSKDKLSWMQERLERLGFTSFWP